MTAASWRLSPTWRLLFGPSNDEKSGAGGSTDTLCPVTSANPTPQPLPVVGPVAPLWSGEWWVDVGVPVLGVVASTVVAIVAIWITLSHARSETSRRERADRSLVGVAAFEFLEGAQRENRNSADYTKLARAFAETNVPVQPLLRWLGEAAVVLHEAWIAAAWDEQESPRDYEYEVQADYRQARDGSPVEQAYRAIVLDIHSRLIGWIRSGDVDASPVIPVEARLPDD